MEEYLVLYPNGRMNWIHTSRRNILASFYKAISCDDLEHVTLPYGFGFVVDGCGKIKVDPQPINSLASRLYPGTPHGDFIVGPVVFVRIELIDGEPDWAPLRDQYIVLLELMLGKKVPARGKA